MKHLVYFICFVALRSGKLRRAATWRRCIMYPAQIYQFIYGDFVATALYGTKLLPPAQAQNTAQFIIV